MIDELSKKIIEIMKNVMPEKSIVEFYIDMENNEKTVKSIGHNKDIQSNFKNEFFDEIYEDEHGTIVDVRIYKEEPTPEKIFEMDEYWIELQKRFGRPVEPYFIITERK